MKVRVTIPITLYRILVTKCNETSLEFRLLKSGVITPGKGEVELLCEEKEASHFVQWANGCHVGAAEQVKIFAD